MGIHGHRPMCHRTIELSLDAIRSFSESLISRMIFYFILLQFIVFGNSDEVFALKRSRCKSVLRNLHSVLVASGLVPALFQKEKKKRKEKSIVRLDKDYESAAQIVNILRQLACPDDSPLKVPTSLLRMTHQS
jgi:hypothetical protein